MNAPTNEPAGPTTDTFLTRLPKAELHVHLEGTLEPEMMLSLAARNGVPVPWSTVEDLRESYRFTGLEHFLHLLFQGAKVLRQRQDFYDLTLAYLAKANAQGVRRAEMFFGAQTFLDADVPIDDQLGGVIDPMHDGAKQWDIDPALILTRPTSPHPAGNPRIRADQASSTCCRERSLTIEMESIRTMAPEWAGRRIGTPHTGLRTEEQFRRWRSRSISSGKSKPARDVYPAPLRLLACGTRRAF